MRNTTNCERAVNKFTRNVGILAAAAAFVGVGSSAQAADLLFDWAAVNSATTPVAGYTPAPFVYTGTGASAVPVLTASQGTNPGTVAVKIVGNTVLTPADNAIIFNNPAFTTNFAFLDFEGAGAAANVTAQSAAIHAQPKGTNTWVGNFGYAPLSGDTSGPAAGMSVAAYNASGVNMANADLYPGSPSYKNPADVGGTSSSPNIRSSLFVLPINRETYVTANLRHGDLNIPYVNRFNNTGNSALMNGPVGSTGFFADAAHGTSGQLLSRGDFSALVLHYRLRGADGIHLLDGGVVGYTQAQFEQDAKAGFTQPTVASIFAAPDHRIATLDTVANVGDPGGGNAHMVSNETSGVVYSGVYSLSQAGGLGKLALLVSNMDDLDHSISFPNKIGGKVIPGFIDIAAGQHKLLDFTGAGTQWTLLNPGGTVVFADSNRDGVGVPEPVAMGGASIFALTMLFRRRRSR
jgi:hypothetical protein